LIQLSLLNAVCLVTEDIDTVTQILQRFEQPQQLVQVILQSASVIGIQRWDD
jgi:hypothetical protein